jgi:hypothetical protein
MAKQNGKTSTIADLREDLFETIKMLKEGEIEVDKAQTISDISGKIIETAKVEMNFLKHVNSTKSEFLLDPETKHQLEIEAKKQLPENQKYFTKEEGK